MLVIEFWFLVQIRRMCVKFGGSLFLRGRIDFEAFQGLDNAIAIIQIASVS